MHESYYLGCDDVIGMQLPAATANFFPTLGLGLTNVGSDYVPGASGAPLKNVTVSAVQGRGARGFELIGFDIIKTGALDAYSIQVFNATSSAWQTICLVAALGVGYRHIGATFRGNPEAAAFRVVGAGGSGTAYGVLHYRIIE